MTFEGNHPNVRPTPVSPDTIFEQYDCASWTVGGQKLLFPVLRVSETGGNRIVERERPYRDGAKLDDTGRKATRWDIEAMFSNNIEEPGCELNGEPLYPNVLNWLIWSFDEHETGDLVVPTRGIVRARAESYSRQEDCTARDEASVSFVFVEDNEDSVDAASLNAPTVNATAVALAKVTEDSAQALGAWDGSFQDLNHLAAELEGLANAPKEYNRDLNQKANMAVAAHRRVVNAFTQSTVDGRDLFLHPSGNRTERKVVMLADRSGKARMMSRGGNPPPRSVIAEQPQSLADIAAMLGLDYEALIWSNPQIEDPFYIPAKTPINIPSDATLRRYG